MSAINIDPSKKVIAVVPSDSADIPGGARVLYTGSGGDITCMNMDGSQYTIKAAPAAAFTAPAHIKRVMATGTAATSILAYT